MRMWMVDPQILCRKHLLGEHVEIHMFVGTIFKGKSLAGYVKNNLVQPRSILNRHDELVREFSKRGYRHNSTLVNPTEFAARSIFMEKIEGLLPGDVFFAVVDDRLALQELLSRCFNCSERYRRIC